MHCPPRSRIFGPVPRLCDPIEVASRWLSGVSRNLKNEWPVTNCWSNGPFSNLKVREGGFPITGEGGVKLIPW